jgi:hypothetical protein
MENEFLKVMREKTNSELKDIVTINRSKFNPKAIEAAEEEIIERNFDENLTIEITSKKTNIEEIEEKDVEEIKEFKSNYSLKWYLISVGLLIFFIFFTPLFLSNSYKFGVPLIQGILISSFVLFGLLNLENLNSILYLEKKNDIFTRVRNIFCVTITLIVSILYLSVHHQNEIDREINKNGLFTVASIIDGAETVTQSYRTGRRSTYNLTINFKTKQEKDYKIITDVSYDVYSNVLPNEVVLIKYLPDDPTILRIIKGNINTEKFK